MKVPYQGREVIAQEVDVLSASEPWCEYQLADGRVLSIKTVLISVSRAVTEKTPDGEPLYLTRTHQVVKVRGVERTEEG